MEEKIIISATIKKSTRDYIIEIAKKEERSFSNVIDLLLQKAVNNLKK